MDIEECSGQQNCKKGYDQLTMCILHNVLHYILDLSIISLSPEPLLRKNSEYVFCELKVSNNIEIFYLTLSVFFPFLCVLSVLFSSPGSKAPQ